MAMVEYFPDPYPDELMYSLISRYHIRSGNIHVRTTIGELFGNSNYFAVVDLPCNIDDLIKNLPTYHTINKNLLIYNHTLYPYYTSFLPKNRSEAIYHTMENPQGRNVYIQAGITTCNYPTGSHLKYCPICNREDLTRFGEYYWHRLHNTPGVLVCPLHKVILKDSSVKFHEDHSRGFTAADPQNCPDIKVSEFEKDVNEKLVVFASDIQWLYDNYNAVKMSQDYDHGFRLKYLKLLADKGLTGSKFKRHFLNRFILDFRAYYGEKFLEMLHSNFSLEDASCWPVKILRKHDKSFHPVRHLLIMRYLCGGPEQFFRLNNLDLSGMEPEKHTVSKRQPANSKSLEHHKNSINWSERDRKTLAEAKILVRRILAGNFGLARITVNLIGKSTGTLSWIKRHPNEMPLTLAYLNTAAESIENFQIRRIEQAALRLKLKGEDIRVWKIEKLAALRPGYSSKVKKAIQNTIDKYTRINPLLKTG